MAQAKARTKADVINDIDAAIESSQAELEVLSKDALIKKGEHEDALKQVAEISNTIKAVTELKNETLRAFEDAESRVGTLRSNLAKLKAAKMSAESGN